jgi:hypothetical protein
LGVLSEHALDGSGGDAMGFGDLTQAVALVTLASDRSMIQDQRIAADVILAPREEHYLLARKLTISIAAWWESFGRYATDKVST